MMEDDEYTEEFYLGKTVIFSHGSEGIITNFQLNNIPCCAYLITLHIKTGDYTMVLDSTKLKYENGVFYER